MAEQIFRLSYSSLTNCCAFSPSSIRSALWFSSLTMGKGKTTGFIGYQNVFPVRIAQAFRPNRSGNDGPAHAPWPSTIFTLIPLPANRGTASDGFRKKKFLRVLYFTHRNYSILFNIHHFLRENYALQYKSGHPVSCPIPGPTH